MRTFATRLLLAAVAALPVAAVAEDLPALVLEVGTQQSLGPSAAPNCDDPGVAWISGDGAGTLHAVKVGTTICSVMRHGGGRRVYRVEVIPVKKKDPPKQAPGGGDAPRGATPPGGGSAPGGSKDPGGA